MRPYSELQKLPASDYLDPENFRTKWPVDSDPAEMKANYEEGLRTAKDHSAVYVTSYGTWGGSTLDGGITTSYMGIGYHSGSADFWSGVLDGPAEVGVYRNGTYTVLKERKEGHDAPRT